MDKPEMDLLSLPDNFKLQILKKLDWKSLKNLKLVCRDFYFIIEKNIQFLDRPKVEHLEISYDKYRPLRVRYDLKDSGNTSFETSKMVEFGNACEYEDFLRNKDFTGIKRLVLNTVTNPELIILSDDSDTRREFSKLNFYTSISNGTSYFEFPQITILSTKKLVIPYNGNLLGMQSLRKLGIFEVNKLSLVLKKIIMDVITGNPMLEYENTSIVDTKRLHVQIANHLFELGLLNPENSCALKISITDDFSNLQLFPRISTGKNIQVVVTILIG
uniref:F-box domain-containing protein n=1 Tax=Strongyloides papillosus TaxID=174720 RepID=A0A0N5BKH7_STREA